MSDVLGLEDPAYLSALCRITSLHDSLCTEHQRMSGVVDALLDGGWRGPAADEFAAGWAQWQDGCRVVLDTLAAIVQAMAWVRARLFDCDVAQAGSVELVRSGLGTTA